MSRFGKCDICKEEIGTGCWYSFGFKLCTDIECRRKAERLSKEADRKVEND